MPFLGLPTIFRCWPSSPGRWGSESLGSLFPWSFLFFLGYHWSFGTCRCFAQHCQIPDFSRTQHSCCHSTRLSGSPRGFWRRGYVLHGGHYSNSSHSHSTTCIASTPVPTSFGRDAPDCENAAQRQSCLGHWHQCRHSWFVRTSLLRR